MRDVVRAAIQEDAHAIGISSYNGGHIEFFSQVLRMLKQQGATDIGVFGGGGGTITSQDVHLLKRRGVDEIFFAGTPLETMVEFVQRTYSKPRRAISRAKPDGPLNDMELGKLLTAAEAGIKSSPLNSQHLAAPERSGGGSTTVIGITGPGGAGKSTLIDELALRFLNSQPRGRLAILSHDPSLTAKGALLGDRAGLVNAQDDRVFMRSIGTRGKAGGLAAATRRSVEILKHGGFRIMAADCNSRKSSCWKPQTWSLSTRRICLADAPHIQSSNSGWPRIRHVRSSSRQSQSATVIRVSMNSSRRSSRERTGSNHKCGTRI